MTVREIMIKDVVTVSPDMSVEGAVALAQTKGVGALPVVEGHKLIGIVTTNDFFYKILNPVLGIGQPGTRLVISNAGQAKNVKEILSCIEEQRAKIIAIHNLPPVEDKEADLCVHLDTEDVSQLIKDLLSKGYPAEIIER